MSPRSYADEKAEHERQRARLLKLQADRLEGRLFSKQVVAGYRGTITKMKQEIREQRYRRERAEAILKTYRADVMFDALIAAEGMRGRRRLPALALARLLWTTLNAALDFIGTRKLTPAEVERVANWRSILGGMPERGRPRARSVGDQIREGTPR